VEPRRTLRFTPAWSTLALVGGLVLAAASLTVIPGKATKTEVIQSTAGAATPNDPSGGSGGSGTDPSGLGGTGGSGPGGNGPSSQSRTGAAIQAKAGTACAAGRNGGNTDVGVSDTSIKLGATVVESGVGASFLRDVRYGMQAVVDKTNRAGGICGRKLSLKLIDDGWSFQQGADFIRDLVEQDKVFALAVVPSSEGLKNVSDSGYIDSQKVPVVGSDGMLINQYRDPYIWPVAASTVSTMHIMVQQAHDAGATEFGIVYETSYHFGIEGAYAFNAAVKRVTGHDIDGYSDPFSHPQCEARFCGIPSGSQYTKELDTFNRSCKTPGTAGACQYVALLLEPSTALSWMSGGGSNVAPRPDVNYNVAGPQPLFTYDFAKSCGATCDQMQLWTGYYPPLGDFLGRPAVSTYVNDIKAASSSADYNNSFVEGGYVGMELVVKALQAVGPNVTRQNLRAVLDNFTFDSGLTAPLTWRPGNHFANTHMRAFSIQYKSGTVGWRDMQKEISDPWVGQDGGTSK